MNHLEKIINELKHSRFSVQLAELLPAACTRAFENGDYEQNIGPLATALAEYIQSTDADTQVLSTVLSGLSSLRLSTQLSVH